MNSSRPLEQGIGSAASVDLNLALFDFLPDAYVVLDTHHTVLAANPRYLELTGQRADAILGQSFLELEQPGGRANTLARRRWLLSVFEALRPGHIVTSPEFRQDVVVAKTDHSEIRHRHWKVEASMAATASAIGDIILVRVQDVTEAAQHLETVQRERATLRSQAQLRAQLVLDAQEEIRAEKEQLDEALAFARIGAWRLDTQNGEMSCTLQCKANIGLPAAEPITRSKLFGSMIDSRDRAQVRAAINDAIRHRGYFEAEYRTTWEDGSLHWIMVRGNGKYDGRGRLMALQGLTLDITQRKEAELRQNDVIAAERHARRASDDRAAAMDGFVSSVSHEIRSPLNAILSWADLLRRSEGAAAAKASDVIERNARQLSLMVDDLLDTGAIVNGKLTVNQAPVDIGALAAAAAQDLRPNFDAKGIVLESHDIHSCMILGDESRLRQVIYNLLSNALKFTAHGRVSVSVAPVGTSAALCVRDEGIGIEADLLPKIFERFQQVAAVGAGRVGGLGLGLWLVKNLAQLHHGSVTVESDGKDRGATFCVHLPLLGPSRYQ